MQPQYSQGAAPSHQPPPYSPPELSQTSNGSVTSSLRQWRKKDFNEKQTNGENLQTNENISHIARVAPHTYYPRPTNDVCHYQYNEYSPPFKPQAPAPVKYSEIVENQQAQSLEQLKKQKEKEYADLCGITPQAHMKQYQELPLKQPYPESIKQQYAEPTIHHQYITKDPQMPFIQKQSQIHHQYVQKEQFQPYMPKYNNQAQFPQTYPSESNNFLAHLSKINPRIAQSIINDAHLRDSQMPMYHNLKPRGSCQQPPQRIYHGPSLHPNGQPPRNLPQGYNYPQSYNYNVKANIQPGDSYGRVHQYQHNIPKYMPEYKLNMEQPIPNISSQRVYSEGVPVNYSPLPSKVSPNYSHGAQLEYAQHYQHRRQFPQDYFTHPSYKAAYLQNHQVPIDENDPEGRTRKSSLKQYLENWVDEDISGNLPDIIVSNNLTDIEGMENLKGALCIKSNGTPEQELYVLDTTEITNESLPHFLHLQQFEKLPDNIRGYYHSTSALAASGRRIIIENQSNGQIEVRTTESVHENGELQKPQERVVEKVPPNVENKVVQIHIVEDGDSITNSRLDGLETIIIQASGYQNEREETCIVKRIPSVMEVQDLKNMPVIDESNLDSAQKDNTNSENRGLCNIASESEKNTNLEEKKSEDENTKETNTKCKVTDLSLSNNSEPKKNLKLLKNSQNEDNKVESSLTNTTEATNLKHVVSENKTESIVSMETKETPSLPIDRQVPSESVKQFVKEHNENKEDRVKNREKQIYYEDSRDYFNQSEDSIDGFYDDRVSMQTPKPLNLSMDKKHVDETTIENLNSFDFFSPNKSETSSPPPLEGINLTKHKEKEESEDENENDGLNLSLPKVVELEDEQTSIGVQEAIQDYSKDIKEPQNSPQEVRREDIQIIQKVPSTETISHEEEEHHFSEQLPDASPASVVSDQLLSSPEVNYPRNDFVMTQTAILTPETNSPVEEHVKIWEDDNSNILKEDKIIDANLIEDLELETNFPTTQIDEKDSVESENREIEISFRAEVRQEAQISDDGKSDLIAKEEEVPETVLDVTDEIKKEKSIKIKIKKIDNNRFTLSNCSRIKKKPMRHKTKKLRDKSFNRKLALLDNYSKTFSIEDDYVEPVSRENAGQETFLVKNTVVDAKEVNTARSNHIQQVQEREEELLLKEDVRKQFLRNAQKHLCDTEIQSQNEDICTTEVQSKNEDPCDTEVQNQNENVCDTEVQSQKEDFCDTEVQNQNENVCDTEVQSRNEDVCETEIQSQKEDVYDAKVQSQTEDVCDTEVQSQNEDFCDTEVLSQKEDVCDTEVLSQNEDVCVTEVQSQKNEAVSHTEVQSQNETSDTEVRNQNKALCDTEVQSRNEDDCDTEVQSQNENVCDTEFQSQNETSATAVRNQNKALCDTEVQSRNEDVCDTEIQSQNKTSDTEVRNQNKALFDAEVQSQNETSNTEVRNQNEALCDTEVQSQNENVCDTEFQSQNETSATAVRNQNKALCDTEVQSRNEDVCDTEIQSQNKTSDTEVRNQNKALFDAEVQSQNEISNTEVRNQNEELNESSEKIVVQTVDSNLEETVPLTKDVEISNGCSSEDDLLLAPTLEPATNEFNFKNCDPTINDDRGPELTLAETPTVDLDNSDEEPPKLEAEIENVDRSLETVAEEPNLEYVVEDNNEEETSVVYQINDSNIVLQIGDELLEINVTAQNGKKVILVKTLSNAIIMNNADENDNTIDESVNEQDEIPVLEPENIINELDVGQNCELGVDQIQIDELQMEEVGDEFCVYNEEVVSSSTEIEVAPLLRELYPPPKEVFLPPKEVAPPAKEISPLPKEISQPPKNISPPPKKISAPPKKVYPPSKAVSPLPKEVFPLPKAVSPPLKAVSPPPKEVFSLPKEVRPPPKEPYQSQLIVHEQKNSVKDIVKRSSRREKISNSENDKHNLHKPRCLTSDNLKPKIDICKSSKISATSEKPSNNHNHKLSNNNKLVDQTKKVVQEPPKSFKTKAALKIIEEPKAKKKVSGKIVKSSPVEKQETRPKKVSFSSITIDTVGCGGVGSSTTVKKNSESSCKRPRIEKEKKEEKKVVAEHKSDKKESKIKEKVTKVKSTPSKNLKSAKVVKDKEEKVKEKKKKVVSVQVSAKPEIMTPVPKVVQVPNVKAKEVKEETKAVKEETKEKQVSVQENMITSSTSSEILVKEALKVADEWENDPDDLKLSDSAFKRRLSLEEYNKRKHLSLEKEVNDEIWNSPKRRAKSPERRIKTPERRLKSPDTPILNVNFNNKTYSRNLSFQDPRREKEEPLSSAIELQLPKINRTPPPKPNLNQEYLKNALLNDLHTVNAYTVSLIKTNQQLMQRFLEQQRLTVDELKKVKKIIRYKRLVQHLSTIRINEMHSTTLKENYLTKDLTRESYKRTDLLTNYRDDNNKKIDPSDFNLNNSSNSYTCERNNSVIINERRKRKRFRFLYSDDDDTIANKNNKNEECNNKLTINNEIENKKAKLDNLVPAMDYSVHQSNSLTLVFKRSFKTDPKMQPYVKIERLASIDLLAKNNCF